MKRISARRRPRRRAGDARCGHGRVRGRRQRQDALPLHRPAHGQVVLVRDRHGRERQPSGASLAARQEPAARRSRPATRRSSSGGRTGFRPRSTIDDLGRRRLRHGQRPRRPRRVVRDDRGHAGRHRRRPRHDPSEARQAAVPLPRHVRLDGERQGDDRRQGRQPPRAAADDRAGARRSRFSTGDETVFLYWSHRVPTVIDASKLKAGDRIVVRVRADGGLSLGEVEATAAKRVADREPKAQESNQSAQA